MSNMQPDLNTEQIQGHWKRHVERQYLGAPDLMKPDGTFTTATVKISGVHSRLIYNPKTNKKERKNVLSLEGKDKQIILNITNQETLEDIADSALTQNWVGLSITLYVTKVKAQGMTMVDAIRIRKAKQ